MPGLVIALIGAIVMVAGLLYALRLRGRGGVTPRSRPWWLMMVTIAAGGGIFAAGLASLIYGWL